MAPSPWLVPITAIRRSPGVRRHELRRGPVRSLGAAAAEGLVVAGSSVAPGAEAEAAVDLDVIVGGIEVSGEVAAPWQGECSRCLRPVGGALRSEVRELYTTHVPGSGEDDEETYPLGTELLDLAPLVRDALLLALPLAPLCRPDCAGLCSTCGADLAEGPCGCDARPADPRWAALDVLKPRGQG